MSSLAISSTDASIRAFAFALAFGFSSRSSIPSICSTSLFLGGDDGWSAIGRIGLGGETYAAAFVLCCGTSAAAAAPELDDEDDDAAADAVAAVSSLILLSTSRFIASTNFITDHSFYCF